MKPTHIKKQKAVVRRRKVPERDRRGGGNKAPLYIRAKARGGDDGRRVDWLGWATSRPRGAARPLGGAGGD